MLQDEEEEDKPDSSTPNELNIVTLASSHRTHQRHGSFDRKVGLPRTSNQIRPVKGRTDRCM